MVDDVIARIDSVLENAPKVGYKASIIRGYINSVRSLITDLKEAIRKIDCIGEAKGLCRDGGCFIDCSKSFKITSDGKTILGKYYSNAFGAIIEDNTIAIDSGSTKVIISGSILKVKVLSVDGWSEREIDLRDYDDVYRNGYMIKYAINNIARPVRKIITALGECAKRSAVMC